MNLGSIFSVFMVGLLIVPSWVLSQNGLDNNLEVEEANDQIILRGVSSSPWPMYQGNPQHTGLSAYNTSDNPGRLQWKFKAKDYIQTSPVIAANGTIYVKAIKLYAILPNGTLNWKLDSYFTGFSTPVINTNGSIIVAAEFLNSIDSNGNLEWSSIESVSRYSSPVIGSNDIIYVCSWDGLCAFYPDGALKWKFKAKDYIQSSPALGSDGSIYFGAGDNYTYAINPNGTEKWKFNTGSSIFSSPSIGSDGTIYIGNSAGNLTAINPNGTLKWIFETPGISSNSPSIDSTGNIYIGCYDDFLYAINPDGTEKWRSEVGIIFGSSHIISSDGIIYIGSTDNYLYAINSNGTLRWKFKTDRLVSSSPAIGADGSIYIGPDYNYLYAVGKTPPDPPQDLRVTKEDGYIKLTWDIPIHNGGKPVLKYRIYRGINPGLEKFLISIDSSKITYNDKNVNSNQTYYYYVIAVNALGEGNPSNEVIFPIPLLADAPWPMYHGEPKHNGLSKYNTSDNPGKLRWKFYTQETIYSSPVIGPDNTIYIGSYDNYLYAIYPNGTEKWRFNAGSRLYSTPAIGSDGTIYVGSENNILFALYQTGEEKWKLEIDGAISTSPVISQDGTVYVGTYGDYLYAVKPNGTLKWSLKLYDDIASSPAIADDGIIYVGSYNQYIHSINPDRSENWRFETDSSVFSSPAIGHDSSIYFGTIYGFIYSISPSGNLNWRFDPEGGVYSSPAVGSDGTIYIGSQNSNLYALNPDGTLKWKYETGDSILSSPAVSADGIIYFGSLDDNLYALYPNGTLKWMYETKTDIQSSPAIDSEGTIYIGSSDGYLYAVGKSVPEPPQNIMATPDKGFINVTWDAPLSDGGDEIIEYRIYRGISSDNISLLNSTGGSIRSYNDTTISEREIYYYFITAVNSIGESYHGGIILMVYSFGPPDPVSYFEVVAGDKYIDLYWNSPSDTGGYAITRFIIYRGIYPGDEEFLVSVSPYSSSYRDPFVVNNQTYYYFIVVVTELGESKPSQTKTATPKFKLSVPSPPQNLTAIAGDGYVILSWNASSDDGGLRIKGYKIYRSTGRELKVCIDIVSPFSFTYQDLNVTNGWTYDYHITAMNSIGEGEASNKVSATPDFQNITDMITEPESDDNLLLIISWAFVILLIIIVLIILTFGKRFIERKDKEAEKTPRKVKLGPTIGKKKKNEKQEKNKV